ncbi:RagB/SusD family nutrient uptake outer membrane protein [Deminuibacter soli]|uniref:RagB/SusD family nutrient uptake outer membrane protein n=1 Tax=Deminuibacter soli TaxID=2291815 RepID=A0A3E1ND44_9BACT|nr:RagB/SusD family nutrient uptake outer membrane protein [Deminuibacter soli]RFM25906.1 RagB/SusD family nutrient uptake outer membrane protein [Deminuibacter soli]
MNRTIYTILTASIVAVLAGCNKQLDLKPSISIANSDALSSTDDVKAAMKGAYYDFASSDFYGGRAFMGPDLLGDYNELNWSGTYQGFTDIYNKKITVDNNFVTSTWLAGYKAINDVNNVLAALPVVKSSSIKSDLEGQAKFIRGAALFQLVRLYAKAWNDGDPATNDGVPVILTPTLGISDSLKVKRSTVAQVYAQVISDLKDAEAELAPTNGFYAGSLAASAMLARVYLQKGDYDNAALEADKVIGSGKFQLMKTFAEAFPSIDPPAPIANTAEDILAMQVTNTSGTNGFNEFYALSNRGDIQMTNNHFALYEEGDDRANFFNESDGSYYTQKFDNLYGNVHTIRLAEMYLIRAEANFRQGTSVGASPADDINAIRTRALLGPIDEADLTLDEILLQRKLELSFEGFTLDDVKRLKGSVGPNYPWNDGRLIYPIPLRETRINPSLTQNQAYK